MWANQKAAGGMVEGHFGINKSLKVWRKEETVFKSLW